MIALVVVGYVVLGIGVLLFFLTVVKKLGRSESSRIKIFEVEVSLPGSLLLVVLGGALAVIGTFGPTLTEPSTTASEPAGSTTDSPFGGTEPATASPYTVVGTFSSPFDGQEVSGRKLPVQGSVEGFSSAGLVCIVRNDVFRYYPYSAQVADGRWSAEVGIGPVNIGRRFTFTLILATANQAAVDELSRRSEADYENGIQTLPAGIQQLTEVRIV